jgi:hypothetical protein
MKDKFETSYGEHLVGIDFNSSADERVKHIKRCAADLIDYIRSQGRDERSMELAITHIENGAMWGVKSVTKPVRK